MAVELTGSKLPLARHCRWWLRDDAKYPELPRSKAADDGVSNHRLLAQLVDTGLHDEPNPGQLELMRHAREFWGNRRGRAEVTFGLDAAGGTAREIGAHLERNYPEKRTPGEIFLTVDAVELYERLATVTDWKTGYTQVDPPDDNLQLLAGGAAAMLAHGTDGAVLEIAHATNGGCFPRRYVASPLVLYQAMNEIAHIQAGIPGSRAKPGEHCRFCPALGGCPETGEMIGRISASPVQWTTEFVSEENDRLLVQELSAVKKMVEAIEDSLKQRVGRGGIHLPNGKVWKAIVCERESLSKKKVEQILGHRISECMEVITYEQFRQVKA